MSLVDYYKRQFAWRNWPAVFDVLPPPAGKTVLDLGCGVGDLAAELAARGARVIGIDLSEELLAEARSRRIPNAEFRMGDLRNPLEIEVAVDGIWAGFVAAYFPDLPTTLTNWSRHLEPKGWIAVTEIDDFFGHEPLSPRTKSLFGSYARDALEAGRYDFHMGRKLEPHLKRSGFTVVRAFTIEDPELAFNGPARTEVIDAWRTRLDGMKLLQVRCGADFERVREEFLACLARSEHRATAKIHCCIATK